MEMWSVQHVTFKSPKQLLLLLINVRYTLHLESRPCTDAYPLNFDSLTQVQASYLAKYISEFCKLRTFII